MTQTLRRIGVLPQILLLGTVLALPAPGQEIPTPELDHVEKRVADKVRALATRLRTRPDDGDLWGRYGMALQAHGFDREAEVAYRAALERDPTELRWPYYLASLHELSDPATALEWLERALALDDDYAPAHIRAAETLETLGRNDDAWSHYARATSLSPGDPLGPFGLGRIALRRGDVEDAVRYLEKAYGLAPKVQAIVASLARAYQRAGRPQLARARAQEARDLPRMIHHSDPLRAEMLDEGVDAQSYLRRAKTYREVGQPERALAILQELIAAEADLVEAHLMAASIHDEADHPQQAMAAAQRALELDASSVSARQILAGALFDLGHFDEAEREADRVLAADPDNLRMLVLTTMVAARAGRVERMLGQLDAAFRERHQDLGLAPVITRLLLEIAASFAEIGQFEEAAKRMDQVLQMAEETAASDATLAEYRRRLELYRSGRPD